MHITCSKLLMWVSGFLLVLAMVMWFGHPRKRAPEAYTPRSESLEQLATTNQSSSQGRQNIQTQQTPPAPTTGLGAAWGKATRMLEILSIENNMPIVFYGKLIDQFGNPVPGASVTGNSLVYSGLAKGSRHVTVKSEMDGLFRIELAKGESLGVVPYKEGYLLATAQTQFKYSHLYPGFHVPDANNPVLIKMWKLQGPQPLLSINRRLRLPPTSDTIRIDLTAGALVAAGGDLNINVHRPEGPINQAHPQSWTLTLAVPEGGFILSSPSESSVTYAAPETGYLKSGVLCSNNGPDLVDHILFVKARGGALYAKLHFLFKINNTPDRMVSLAFDGVVNTNSSRNWESAAAN